MLQRQIIKTLDKQIGTDNLAYTKYTIASFLFMAWMIISVNITIYRTTGLAQRYEISPYIMTTKLRNSI